MRWIEDACGFCRRSPAASLSCYNAVLRDWLPELPLLPLHHITWGRGLRPCMPDELPALGCPRSLENLVVATGGGLSGGTASSRGDARPRARSVASGSLPGVCMQRCQRLLSL